MNMSEARRISLSFINKILSINIIKIIIDEVFLEECGC
jgi:hypothetical protein